MHQTDFHQTPYLCKVSVDVRTTPFTSVSWMVKPDSCIEYCMSRLMRVPKLKLSASYAAFDYLFKLPHQLVNVSLNHLSRLLCDRMIRRKQLRIVENLLTFK